MNVQYFYPWAFTVIVALLYFTQETHQLQNVHTKGTKQSAVHTPTSSRRDVISGFNRESLVDSHEEYFMDPTSLGNQLNTQDDVSMRSEAAGQQGMFLSGGEIDENSSPLGETQLPTIAATDYKIAYSDGLPFPTHPTRGQGALLVYDTPQDPLDQSDSNTVKIADPMANKKLFSHDGFSHGMGELNNAINTLLIDKVLSSDNDKDFNKELKLLSEEFSKDEDSDEKNNDKKPSGEKKPECQPNAKSIFANCKKKRSAVCSPEDHEAFFKNALNIHNLFRKIHGVPDLEMNDKLSKDAQDYAEHLANTASSAHSLRRDRPGQGENIAVGCTSAGSELRSKEAISQWYSKACQNNFDFSSYKKGVEPFAQLVWKSTAFLGMGKAVSNRDGNLCTYIVARYSPEGDKNSFVQNVPRGTFSKRGICSSACVVKGEIVHPKAKKIEKQLDDKPIPDSPAKSEELSTPTSPEINVDRPKEEKPKTVKKPVQPEIKKVENKKTDDENSHEFIGSTKIRNDELKEGGKAAETIKAQKPKASEQETAHASVQEISAEESKTSHGLAKINSNNMRVITDQDFAAANAQQHSQSNVSSAVKGNWAQEQVGEQKGGNSLKEGIQVLAKEPTPKVPMLINITFPKQLQTKNNSMIQITVGDENPVKPVLPEQASFKPVENFAGNLAQLENSNPEYLENEGRNDRLNEGRLSEQRFMGSGTLEKNAAVGYKMSDFAFDSKKEHQTVEGKLENATVIDAASFDAKISKIEPQHMFQDRKGMNSKNTDNSVTYMKIANKLMHDKDSTSDVDYFMPKQLESEAGSNYAKEKNDYGFTDETEEEKNSKNENTGKKGVRNKEKKLNKGNKDSSEEGMQGLNGDTETQEFNEIKGNNENDFKDSKGKNRNEESDLKSESNIDAKGSKANKSKGKNGDETNERMNSNEDVTKESSKYVEDKAESSNYSNSHTDSSNVDTESRISSKESKPEESKERFTGSSERVHDNNEFGMEEDAGNKLFSNAKAADARDKELRGSKGAMNGKESTSKTRLAGDEDKKGNDEFGFTANVNKVNMDHKQDLEHNDKVSKYQESKSALIKSGVDKLRESYHHNDFGFTAEADHVDMNNQRQIDNHGKGYNLNKDGDDSPVSNLPEAKEKKQKPKTDSQEEESPEDDKKFLKLADAEILDHKIERKKQFGKMENGRFMKIEKQILSQQDNIFHKSPEDVKDLNQVVTKVDTEVKKPKGNESVQSYNLASSERVNQKEASSENVSEKGSSEKTGKGEFFMYHKKQGLQSQDSEFEVGNKVSFSGQNDRNHEPFVGLQSKSHAVESSGSEVKSSKEENKPNEGMNHFDGNENEGMSDKKLPVDSQKAWMLPELPVIGIGALSENKSSAFDNKQNMAISKETDLTSENYRQHTEGNVTAHPDVSQNTHSDFSWRYEGGKNGVENDFSEHNRPIEAMKNKNDTPPFVKQIESVNSTDDASNSTTINVGTGFIKIRYEPPTIPSAVNRNPQSSESYHVTSRESSNNVVGNFYSTDPTKGGMIESERNLGRKEGASSHENGAKWEGVGTHDKAASNILKTSDDQSFSPVINRENTHHFIINIKPTKSLEKDKQTGKTIQKYEADSVRLVSNKEEHEFFDMSNLMKLARKNVSMANVKHDLQEDLMEDNVDTKSESNFISYSNYKSKEDLGSLNEGKNYSNGYIMGKNRPDKATEESDDVSVNYHGKNAPPSKLDLNTMDNSMKYAPGTNSAEPSSLGRDNPAWSKEQKETEGTKMKGTVSFSSDERKFPKEERLISNSESTFFHGKPSNHTDQSKDSSFVETQDESTKSMKEIQKIEGSTDSGLKSEERIKPDINASMATESVKQLFAKPSSSIDQLENKDSSRIYAKYDSSDIISTDSQSSSEADSFSESKDQNEGLGIDKQEQRQSESLKENTLSTGKTRNVPGHKVSKNFQSSEDANTEFIEASNDKKLFDSIEKLIQQEERSTGVNILSEESAEFDKKISKNFKSSKNADSPEFVNNEKDTTSNTHGSIACKSNCEKPYSDKEDESKIVGFNVEKGFDQFSGFNKFRHTDGVRGNRLSESQETPSKFMKDDSNRYEDTGKQLIFIPDEAIRAFQRDMTEEHNKYRAIHDAPLLHLDVKLSRESQSYAKKLARKGNVAHSTMKSRPHTGESIEKLCTNNGGMPSASKVIKKWYDEVCNPGYVFTRDGKQPGTGHFTQVVWKKTRSLGIGLAASKEPNGHICSYVVARYYKAGNDLATIRSNVARGTFRSCNKPNENVRKAGTKKSGSRSGYEVANKRRRPTKNYPTHYTSQPTSRHRYTKNKNSYSNYYNGRGSGLRESGKSEFIPITVSKHSKSSAGKDNHSPDGFRTMGSEFYTVSAKQHGKGASMFAKQRHDVWHSKLSNNGVIDRKQEEPFTGRITGKEGYVEDNSFSHGIGHKYGEANFHNNAESHSINLKGGKLSDTKSPNLRDIPYGSTLLEKPRYDEFNLNSGSKQSIGMSNGFHSTGTGKDEFDLTYKTKQAANGFPTHTYTYMNKENTHGNQREGKHFSNIHSTAISTNYGHNKAGSNTDEFFNYASRLHRPLQSQFKSKQHDSTHTTDHLASEENKEFQLTGINSYHGKEKSQPYKSLPVHQSLMSNHKQIKGSSSNQVHQSKQKSLNHYNQMFGAVKGKDAYSNGNVEHSNDIMLDKLKLKNAENMHQYVHGKNGENFSGNKASQFHSKEAPPVTQPQTLMQSHQKAGVHARPISLMKGDAGYLEGLHAAMGFGSDADAKDFYDEPVGRISASNEAYGGIGNVRDLADITGGGPTTLATEGENEMDLNSLREEGSKLEAAISSGGTKTPDQSFEDSLINSVKHGTADVMFEKNPEDYKIPSVLIDEYRYDTPENGGGENIYEMADQQMGEKMGKISSGDSKLAGKNRGILISGREKSSSKKKFSAQGTVNNNKVVPGIRNSNYEHRIEDKIPLNAAYNRLAFNNPAVYANKTVPKLNGKVPSPHEISFAVAEKPAIYEDKVAMNRNIPFKSKFGFQSGFQDALSAFGGFDDGKVMDVTATKKGFLSRMPPNSGQTSDRHVLNTVTGTRKDKVYDTSRTRHFVIDKNRNLILKPGEETGDIADYEAKHLADLTHQATYGINSVANMFKSIDITGLNSLQKVIPDQKDFQSGVLAWSGPYNPGLPNEEEVKQSDISGQDLVQNLERPGMFKEGMLSNSGTNTQAVQHETNSENVIYRNSNESPEAEGRIIENGNYDGQVMSNFHKVLKNLSDIDDDFSSKSKGIDEKLVGFQEKARDHDLKFSAEEDFKEKENVARRTDLEDMDTFRQNALMWHNKLRCVHYADQLRLNESLSKEADDYASEIVNRHNGVLDHSKIETRNNEGENLAMTCSGDRKTLTGAEATFKWYNDICEKGYDFRSNEIQKGTGHFTQLAWQRSTDFGIGRAMLKKNGRYCTVIVARYYPKGNVPKEFLDNVKQGAYSDKTCETLTEELTKKTTSVECNLKQEEKSTGQESRGGASGSVEKLSMEKPLNVTKEREKARIHQEIEQVTEIINRLEKESKSKMEDTLPSAGAFTNDGNFQGDTVSDQEKVKSEELKGEELKGGELKGGELKGEGTSTYVESIGNEAPKQTFSDLGGTGSPVIVYHGVTGHFEDPKTFTNIGIETHNKLRKIHKAPELKLDVKLAMEAFKYATYLTQLGYLKHDNNLPKDQGENLAIGCFDNNSEMSSEDAVSRWYYEVCQPGYKFKSKVAASGTGHFTQVVWKSTKKIGIAKQTRMHGNLKCTYIVARYSPAGNVHGEFDKNVEQGDFNDGSVCKELMHDLMRFQERNEKLVPHLESGLKQAQAEAKVQMALMQLKAMAKQKGKQNEKQGQKAGQKPKGTADASKTKGFLAGSKVAAIPLDRRIETAKRPAKVSNKKLTGSRLTKGNQQTSHQNDKIVTGVLENGLKTILEKNHNTMHIGPTVKIIESQNGGGFMYRKIEGPSIRYHDENVNNGLMSDGQMAADAVLEQTDEFSNPLDSIRLHESSQQNPFKTPHANRGNNGMARSPIKAMNSQRRISSSHLNSATFDPVTSRIIETEDGESSFTRPQKSGNSFVQAMQTPRKVQGQRRLANKNGFTKPQNGYILSKRPLGISDKFTKLNTAKISSNSASKSWKPLKSLTMKNPAPWKSPIRAWLPSRKPIIIRKPEQPHQLPASLMRILQGRHQVHALPKANPHVVPEHAEQHKIPDSLLRMLKGNQLHTTVRTFTPTTSKKPIVQEEAHRIPESLKRILNAKSNTLHFTTTTSKSTLAPPKPEHVEHKIPESLRRILNARKASKTPTPRYLTEKPYSIKLDGHEVPYSLFKMLTAEAASGKDPKVSNYLMKTPFKIVQSHHDIPDSLKKILNGRSKSGNVNMKTNTVGKADMPEKVLKPENVGQVSEESIGLKGRVFDQPGQAALKEMQEFQQPITPQVESYATVAPNALQQVSPLMFSSPQVPYQQHQQVNTFSLATFPTPVMGVARTTVAARYPAAVQSRAVSTGIKGPSLANIGTGSKRDEPLVVKSMDTPTENSFNPFSTTKASGVLLSLDTEKDREEFERSSLETHNQYRRMHRANPLKLDYGMSIQAEQYARRIAQTGRLDHSGTEDGENIASVCRKQRSLMSGSESTDIWYKEACNPGYDFKSERPGGSGHFTQVVWRDTTQLGVGRAEAMHNGLICTYVVARYRPAGNFVGEFSKNVLRGSFDGSKCSRIAKKSAIERSNNQEKTMVSKPIKRSRIPSPKHVKSSRKTVVDFDGERHEEGNEHQVDDAIASKVNSVWLPDLESGFQSSDIAGLIPLSVEAGEESHLKKFANSTMDELNENDRQLATNFASKLRKEVEKVLNSKTAQGKSKTENEESSKEDIDAASVGFQNMETSFKKSEPTLPPEKPHESLTDAGISIGIEKIGSNPISAQSGNTRSGENPMTADLATQVNQAVQKLQSAAQSVSNAVASSMTNSIASSALTGIQAANNNAAMSKFAANMISATGANSVKGSNAAQFQPAASSSAAGVANPPPNGLSTNSGPAGSLAASNVVSANQQALSKAAEDKKIASEAYKPSEFEQSGLNAHNKYRSVHDAPPLVLNQDLSKDAEAWAQQCAALGMPRRSPSPDGENVVESCKPANQEMTATEATETWYSEMCNPGYNFGAAEITGVERFTQVVWKSSTEMGIGKATRVKADLLCTYIVARYRPTGNVLGDVKSNVLSGSLDSKHFCEQFIAAAKMSGKNRILENLPVKIERMEEAGSVGSTLHAGKSQPEEEIIAGGDDPAADGPTQNKKDFRMEALYTHNRFRAIHNAPPLQLDVKKCQEAEEMAANLAAKGSMMRSKDNINGQNIAMSCNKDGIEMSGDEATNKWYNEICNPGYDFKGPYAFGAAHFMQVVWASSKKFGIGKATTTLDNMLCTWVVALYEPSGVMRNMEKENVLLGLFDYRYCDTFGKGGGGKGASSGAIHSMTDTKISAPNAAGQPAGKRGLLIKNFPSEIIDYNDETLTRPINAAGDVQEFIKPGKGLGNNGDIKAKDEVYGSDIVERKAEDGAGKKRIKINKRKHKKYSRTKNSQRNNERIKKHRSHHRKKHHRRYHRHHHNHHNHHHHNHHNHRMHKRHTKGTKESHRIS